MKLLQLRKRRGRVSQKSLDTNRDRVREEPHAAVVMFNDLSGYRVPSRWMLGSGDIKMRDAECQ